MAFRLDIGSVLRSPRRTADGALRVDATLTRTGVFRYVNPDGSITREYRPPEEVFDAESMASFEALPITDDHPPVMVTPENLEQYKRGRSGDTIRRDGIHMVGGLIIEDKSLQSKMDAGKREVSNGYTCDLDPTPGISPDGEEYDVIQRKIRGNHIAIVDAGRAGSARVRMDGAAVMIPTSEAPSSGAQATRADATERISTMEELQKKLGEALVQLAKAEADRDMHKNRADKAEGERDTFKAAADKAEGERDEHKARADKAEGERDSARKDAADSIPTMVKERAALVAKATAVLGADAKIKRADGAEVAIFDAEPRELHIAVIEKVDGDKVAADKSAAYVEGRFDAAYARADKSGKALEQARTIVTQPANAPANAGKTDGEDREEAARRKMIKDGANEWQTSAPALTDDKE